MIVLPDTPPTPQQLKAPNTAIPAQLLTQRSALDSLVPISHADSIRQLVKLEDYIEQIFDHIASDTQELALVGEKASQTPLCSGIPWSSVSSHKLISQWMLSHEALTAIVASCFMYIRLAAELANEIIEVDPESQDNADNKWKSVTSYYKKSMSLCAFGAQFSAVCEDKNGLNPQIFALIDQISSVGLQMSILCKSSYATRTAFVENECLTTGNSGLLCRVAIWVMDEIRNCLNLVKDLQASSKNSSFVELSYSKWPKYLSVFQQYAAAYAGMFLSIEHYQKDKLGLAIGLVNFSLLSLQSKYVAGKKPEKRKVFLRLKSKIAGKRNEAYILNLQSITSLSVDKSVFQDLSGVILNDLTFLFDQLVLLHLKFTKENENIKFDSVVDWQDIHTDSKWPLGCKIPVSAISLYLPRSLVSSVSSGVNVDFTGRGLYF